MLRQAKNVNIAGIDITFSPKVTGLRIGRSAIRINGDHPFSSGRKPAGTVFETKYWSFCRRDGHKVFTLKPSVSGKGAVAIFDHSLRRGTVYLADESSGWRIATPIVGNALALRGKFLFHGSGVIDKNKGYLFLGDSGAGKTTISRLWVKKGAKVIHDDIIIVYKKNSEFVMTGLSIAGKKEFNGWHLSSQVGLTGIFFLKHGAQNTLTRKSYSFAFASMARNHPILACDKLVLSKMFDFYSELARRTPVYDLNFKPDARCVDFIRKRGG